ncbi:MAG TPA: VWA domain-containing protein [Steroidobacteraceae bacterium]|nr:VWA domain-containing protein [Steroidobacteraceae bacterium]
MNFASPGWLAAGLAGVVALLWLWRRYDARQHAALAKFVSAHLRLQLTRSISPARRRLQRGLFLGALIALFVALAGPQVGFHWEQVSRRGNEIIFAIDTSRSMLTPDVKPNRLTRAKLAIDDFAEKLEGDAVGIVAFAGTAFLACPITLDYGAFHETLSAIDTNTIPRGGTNISSAIQTAQAALRRRPGSDKILILVTDGEDLEGSAFEAAEAAAKADGLKIYTVGVGTAAGDLIPISAQQGGGFVKDDTGAFVRSRLDEQGLKAISGATGGFYVPLGTQAEGLELIFQTVLGSIAKHDLASRQQKIYIERYQWPLAGSLAMLLLSLLIGSRRRSRARVAVLAAAPPIALALMVLWLPAVQAASLLDPKAPVLEYNAGTSAYRAGQFPQAARSFQQSISHALSDDPKRLAIQEDAYYNLGNALYRSGQKTVQNSPQETLQKWNDAVKAYDTALQLRADDADSKFNRDLVKRKIEELQQNQNSQNKNKDQSKNKDPSQNKDQSQSKDQSQGQDPRQNPQNKDPGQPPKQDPKQGQQDPKQGQQDPKQGQQDPKGGEGQAPPQPNTGDAKGGQPPSAGQPPAPKDGEPQGSSDDARSADNQRLPGQMSREEARELLDSVKGDEHQSLAVPSAQRGAVRPPDKPFKNW